jgi:cobalt-zinc-cadmium efflux system membrane fusion protein
VLAIPSDAIVLFEGSTAVFRLEHGNEFSPVTIEAGTVAGGWTEIRAGIAVGDEIATGGVFLLKSLLLKSSMGEGHVH